MSAITNEDLPPVVHLQTKVGTFRSIPTFGDLCRDIEAVEKLGKWIFRSKMFGCDWEEQAMVIASECYLTGVTPLEYQKRNKIVAGKPFQQYDSMLATFNEAGGRHKIVRSDPDGSTVEFTFEGQTIAVTLTWQELSQEPLCYACSEKDYFKILEEKKVPPLKAKYATPRSRQTMIFARLVSDALRKHFPQVNFGRYTEEEVLDILDAESVNTVPSAPAIDQEREERKRRAIEAKQGTTEPTVESKPTKTESVESKPESKTVEAETPVPPTDKPAPNNTTDEALLRKITDELATQIKTLLAEAAESGSDYRAEVVGKLKQNGYEKIAQLRMAEGMLLREAIQNRNIKLWTEANLIRFDELPF
jgi:hypothetical protein